MTLMADVKVEIQSSVVTAGDLPGQVIDVGYIIPRIAGKLKNRQHKLAKVRDRVEIHFEQHSDWPTTDLAAAIAGPLTTPGNHHTSSPLKLLRGPVTPVPAKAVRADQQP